MSRPLIDLLVKHGWRSNNPASMDMITELARRFDHRLPEDYASILQFSNGGSLYGFKTPLIVYPVTEVLALHREGDLYEDIPKSLIFGGDGGGTIYVHDLRDDKDRVLFFREGESRYDNIIHEAASLTRVAEDIIGGKKLN